MSNMDGHIDRLVFRRRCIRYVSSSAQNGRFELYKTTADHEAKVGRKQHGYASPEELAG